MEMDNLLAIGTSNWDYILMEYNDGSIGTIAIAKPGSGASDCCFGNIRHFIKCYRSKDIGSLTALGEKIVFNL